MHKLYRREDIDAYDLEFDAFDTINSITVYHAADAPKLLAQILKQCWQFQDLWNFSNPESDIARINAAGLEPLFVHPLTAGLLSAGIEIAESTPSFNIAAGSLTYLWKKAATIPSEAEINAALSHTKISRLNVFETIVWKDDPGLKVDVGGIAKGFIADHVCQMIREADVPQAKVDLGGSLAFVGLHPEGRPWKVHLGETGETYIDVEECFIACSGNNQRARMVEGTSVGHVIDPRTGHPAQPSCSLSAVVSRSGVLSDALSTVCLMSSESEQRKLVGPFESQIIDIYRL